MGGAGGGWEGGEAGGRGWDRRVGGSTCPRSHTVDGSHAYRPDLCSFEVTLFDR